MITTVYTLGVIFATIAVLGMLFCIYMCFHDNNPVWLFGFIIVALFGGIGGAMITGEPHNRDVLGGKAHYVKVVHYDGNKETVTYTIVWDDKIQRQYD